MRSIDEVHTDLIDVSADIGRIHGCNNRYTYGLARIIWERGKCIDDLTVRELITLTQQYTEAFNRLHRIEDKSA